MAERENNLNQSHASLSPARLAVLVSEESTGSNLWAMIHASTKDEIPCRVGLVISNRPDARGVEIAKKFGITYRIMRMRFTGFQDQLARARYGVEIAEVLSGEGTDLVVLEGFNTILAPSYFANYRGVTLNIHPGLLPESDGRPYLFPDGTPAPWNQGLMTDKAVKNFLNLRYAGSTIHQCTEIADLGPVFKRVIVGVEPGDTVETLYIQRLKPAENRGLVEVLKEPPVKN